ncbi:MAG: patatin family protein [Gammaproteobacteria bacterium]|nr:patatin family protein [Gammaproteobacteria bacterium]NIR85623.1 patatin family protein [Gammaproteobacteria bacterium]NIR90111.1 patatin family protein [Gammaproteobacteria bacterium]NIU06757.1 patatin family protein [Gammaproteobacteria bacterium]NIV53690.1 patatin family protein [Gammaproteobacteria bacterium]
MVSSSEQASRILAETAGDLDALKVRIKELKGTLEYGLARKALEGARDRGETRTWIIQQLALCTYKDEELPPDKRFSKALSLLESIGLRNRDCQDAETLALGGAVYKRRWLYGGQLDDLYEALAFYRAAWERNPKDDMGYGGVNAAYILDILAVRAERVARHSGTVPKEAEQLFAQGRALREAIRTHLEACHAKDRALETQDWFAVTLAEVYFGLREHDQAGEWLARTAKLDRREWEQETTARQLVSLAGLQGNAPPREGSDAGGWAPPWQALHRLLGDGAEPAFSCYRGKVGLALSGGGFRASFYHLGVLARLAEMDVLRSVEVLSTVSGGSIVGAHYYLELKHLLESHPDRSLTPEDYIALVRRVQQDFLAGVQKNPRTRVLTSLLSNLKMLFSSTYTRSHRIGELYEKHLYSRVKDGHSPSRRREMPELLIAPADEPSGSLFKPKFSNWRRRAKVPVLLLNTTSLNSGHNWHFTARSMGEPPGLLGAEVDINERYRRLHYEQAPSQELQHYPLGWAVAASSCVPGLFDPLVIKGLYEDRTVRLVDGGVHDNQGVAGLLDEACTLILCSDASGQMEDVHEPGDSLISAPLRSNSIMMDRVREAQYADLRKRLDSHALDGLFFVHMKQDLATPPLDWISCQDPTHVSAPPDNKTPYGIDRDVQRKLAAVRTDLDSFTEVEAYSLMLSGYLMTEHQFLELQRRHALGGGAGTWADYDIDASRESWSFLDLEPIAAQPGGSADPRRVDLEKQLDAAASLFFKSWKLCDGLKRLAWSAGAVAVALLIAAVIAMWRKPIPVPELTLGEVLIALAVLLAGIAWPLVKWLNPEKAVRGRLQKAGLALAGFVLTNIHVHLVDRFFLKRGRLNRLLALGKRP